MAHSKRWNHFGGLPSVFSDKSKLLTLDSFTVPLNAIAATTTSSSVSMSSPTKLTPGASSTSMATSTTGSTANLAQATAVCAHYCCRLLSVLDCIHFLGHRPKCWSNYRYSGSRCRRHCACRHYCDIVLQIEIEEEKWWAENGSSQC